MKKFSRKRAIIEREYKKVWREMAQDLFECSGCGRNNVRITPSHLISRRRAPHLIADRDNIRGHCVDCQDLVETGKYDLLNDGVGIIDYIKSQDPEYYRIKTLKWTG